MGPPREVLGRPPSRLGPPLQTAGKDETAPIAVRGEAPMRVHAAGEVLGTAHVGQRRVQIVMTTRMMTTDGLMTGGGER